MPGTNSSRAKKTAPKTLAEEITAPAGSLPPPPADRIRMVTWEEYEYSIDPMVMDDATFMETLGELDEKPYLIAKMVKLMLGEEQWEKFKVNHRDENGRITSERLAEFMDVLNKELTALGN